MLLAGESGRTESQKHVGHVYTTTSISHSSPWRLKTGAGFRVGNSSEESLETYSSKHSSSMIIWS